MLFSFLFDYLLGNDIATAEENHYNSRADEDSQQHGLRGERGKHFKQTDGK